MTSTVRVNNPFHGYARCGWCGPPEHTECMGDDDKPAIEVCEGRRMLSTIPAEIERPITVIDGVPHAPCMKCGAMLALVDRRAGHRIVWCRNSTPCQVHKKWWIRLQERKCAAPPPTARCICGKVFTPRRAAHKACSDACRTRARQDRDSKRSER